MPYIRRLPSAKWQATVRLPNGHKTTRTDPLKKVVAAWATQVEAEVARGRWRDPRAGRSLTLAEWRKRWLGRRLAAPATLSKNETHWRLHIEPALGALPLDTIDRPAVTEWVAAMRRDGVGAHTIEASAHHLGKLLADAVEEGLLAANPAARLRLPPTPLRAPFFWTRAEADAILAVPRLSGSDRLLIDLDLHVGLRIGELGGLWAEQVDVGAGVIHVTAAQTRFGRQPYTKGRRKRTVPIPAHLLEAMAARVQGRPGDALVFPAPNGGPLDDTHFRARVFVPALKAAGVRIGSPHDMRHTAASWLVMAGVDLYRVQALLGHESFKTTMRYAHLAPSAFDAISAAWQRGAVRDDGGARVAHGGLGAVIELRPNGL